jgi:hypothetical protein
VHTRMPVAERAELPGGGTPRLKRPTRIPEGAWSVSAGAMAGLRMLPTDPRWTARAMAAAAKVAREGGCSGCSGCGGRVQVGQSSGGASHRVDGGYVLASRGWGRAGRGWPVR